MGHLRELLPKEPMAPISTEKIEAGDDWGYQLKWDGVRILAGIDHQKVSLYSRKLLDKTSLYPEVVAALSKLQHDRLLLDGEVVYFHPELGRPVFQKVLQRERSRSVRSDAPHFTYVLFDILVDGDKDMRKLPYLDRHHRLKEIVSNTPGILTADLFLEGESLWAWAEERGWEGIVMKRLSSPYREGKKHRDWYKKKIAITMQAEAVALIIREGRVASLVLADDENNYIGRASLGLNEQTKQRLLDYTGLHPAGAGWNTLHADLKKEQLAWLSKPLTATVTFLEWSQDGMMRHPKLLSIEGV
ncbi:ATP-dependent DNA ligase [Paenibacillus ihbetae]|uniref:DNA ligase n=1 Tax=Paenibacillus ihbetae TaxID=1870820 RepID=A0A1B2E3M5_9BACL|nr:DNA ligase [Paenibacillus ihbetae]ANY74563.1 DNA ligase [Paenibacillus ihbetae]OOC63266.1 DNA ligase [Paenibacillus ihbetae]